MMANSVIPSDRYAGLHDQITSVVKSTRLAAARSVNVLMTATYWDIGRRIVDFEQGGDERAAYGDALIKRLGDDLSRQFGRGFGWRNLTQMRAFYLSRPAETILQTASAKSETPSRLQTSSAISAGRSASEANAIVAMDPMVLAKAFPLPWSAYVRLLLIKNAAARRQGPTAGRRKAGRVVEPR